MFFKALHLKAYGHFTDRWLTLGDRPGLSLVTGANEAGKSTLLRAITGLLFGFAHRAEDNFLHSNTALRVGARIGGADGEDLTLYRRRGNSGTLLDADDAPVDDALLSRRLAGVSESFYRQVMGLDHARLREHGETLLREEGLLGYSLFEAGLGVGAVRGVITRFQSTASDLYRPRGQRQPINAALRGREDHRRALRQATLRPAGWRQLQEGLDAAEKTANDQGEAARAARAELAALERIGQTRETLNRLLGLWETLRELAEVPDLPESAPGERQTLERQLERLKTEQRTLEERVHAAQERLRELHVDDPLLESATRLKALMDQRGRYLGAREDRIGLETDVARANDQIGHLIRECRLAATPDTIAENLPRRVERQALRRLLDQQGRLDQQALDRRARIAELRDTVDRLAPELGADPEIPDPVSLERTVRDIQAMGNITEQARQAAESRDREQREAQHALEDLPLFSGDATALAGLSVPMPEACQRFEESLRGAETEIARLETRREDLGQEQRTLAERLRKLEGAAPPPTEADLRQARQRRDQGWTLVRQMLSDGHADPEGLAAFAGDEPLLSAYPVTVLEADAIADHMRADADRVAEHAVLRQGVETLSARLKGIDEAHAKAERTRAETLADWRAQWNTARIMPGNPAEMSVWLAKRQAALDAHRRVQDATRRAADAELRVVTAEGLVRDELLEHGIQPPKPSDLAGLLALSVSEIDTRRTKRAERAAREADLARGQEALATAERQAADDATLLAAWDSDWKSALARVHLPADTQPDLARDMLELLDELDEVIQRRAGFGQRLLEIDRFSEGFRDDVRDLAERLMPGAATGEPDIAIAGLARALADSEAARKDRAKERQTLLDTQARLKELEDQRRHLIVESNRLCEQAGCGKIEDLPAIEARAAEKRASTVRARELEESLRAAWDNRPVSEIRTAIEAEDPVLLESRVLGLRERVQYLQADLDTANQEVGRLRQRIANQGEDSSAAEASQEVALAEDTIRKHLRPYLENALAAAMLRRAVELYRGENQGPLLERARVLFARLTTGRYAGLVLGEDDHGEPVLMGQRAKNGEQVAVANMSDGTRDQLFLALRLAVIEARAREQGPLPFIADDLLINFDDSRSTAAFGVLADLAATHGIQVLFLTHHPHMVDLARAAISEDAMTISALDG